MVYRLKKGENYHVCRFSGGTEIIGKESGRVVLRRTEKPNECEIVAAGDEAVRLFDGTFAVRAGKEIYLKK